MRQHMRHFTFNRPRQLARSKQLEQEAGVESAADELRRGSRLGGRFHQGKQLVTFM